MASPTSILQAFPLGHCAFRGERVRAERLQGGLARLVLDRPARRNALDAAMVRELSRCLEMLASEPAAALRLLLLEGEGEAFCAGADVAWLKAQTSATPEENLEEARSLARMFHALAAFPAPVLCAVRGAALGGGLGLAACADLVIAEEPAVFGTPELRLGLAPAVISPYLLRRLGLAQAAPLMLGGARLGAAEAHRIGLVHRVLPREAWGEGLVSALRELLAAAPEASRRTKALLLAQAPLPGPELVEATARHLAEGRASGEGQAGLSAFLGKVLPPWDPGAPAAQP